MISFATLGAVLAPLVHFDQLSWTHIIVFGSLCLVSYSFDELKGRPLAQPSLRANYGCWDGPASLLASRLESRLSPTIVSFHRPRRRFLVSEERVSYLRGLPQPLGLQSGSRFETSESNGQGTTVFFPTLVRQFFRRWETVLGGSRSRIVGLSCSAVARSRERSLHRLALLLWSSL